jgi:hypothetical protein
MLVQGQCITATWSHKIVGASIDEIIMEALKDIPSHSKDSKAMWNDHGWFIFAVLE